MSFQPFKVFFIQKLNVFLQPSNSNAYIGLSITITVSAAVPYGFNGVLIGFGKARTIAD
tara:strand:+ start:176 stop:352 length:177 start_codon:yes stop_codon:yes gene_type:complete